MKIFKERLHVAEVIGYGVCLSKIMNDKVIRISAFDGQTVWLDRHKTIALYDLGNYLGGGIAGTVYQCEDRKGNHFALKILNPVGYKILSPGLIRRCVVIHKGGATFSDSPDDMLTTENVWWLVHATTKQYVPAYFTQKHGLRELTLSQCVDVWGTDLTAIDTGNHTDIVEGGVSSTVPVPNVPPKYVDFLQRRQKIFREINNMYKIPPHPNVVALHKVMELYQESKSTIFLIMELANGGELFDQIKIDHGTEEDLAKFYFRQVIEGLQHCHAQGVCHRDLKPENLLLMDVGQGRSVLKIADFGFSSHFSEEEGQQSKLGVAGTMALTPDVALIGQSPLRALKSVVGSPFYAAPEVLQADICGYDGPKADIWSLGIILYAMLAGNLPFDQEFASCKRFKAFCKWVGDNTDHGWSLQSDGRTPEYPPWLFPAKFSVDVRSLIVGLLHPDPCKRFSVSEAKLHPWCRTGDDDIVTSVTGDSMDLSEEGVGSEEDEFDGAGLPEEAFFSMEDDRVEGVEFDNKLETSPVRRSLGPPLAPLMVSMGLAVSDLFSIFDEDEKLSGHSKASQLSYFGHTNHCEDLTGNEASAHGASSNPPSFNDGVKRSTRFVTYVPAHEIFELTERILMECRVRRTPTPLGVIGKVEVYPDPFRIEIWGTEVDVPPLCAIQLYQMPSPLDPFEAAATTPKQLFLVEFLRGQLEIFTFKRFYQWLRQNLSELIKMERHATPELSDKDISLMSYASPSHLISTLESS